MRLPLGSLLRCVAKKSVFHDHYCPALTTVRQPHRELGTTAVRMLLERIRDVEASIPNQLLEGKLIVRESTGHPPIN